MVILGIDPGTSILGFGLIEKNKNNFLCKNYGCIKTSPASDDAEKLAYIASHLDALIKKTNPDKVVVEKIFFFKNKKTAGKVAEARGVILSVCAQNSKKVVELTPLQIKQAISCYGRAEKAQVQKMVKLILGLDILPTPDDAADALAGAIAGADL